MVEVGNDKGDSGQLAVVAREIFEAEVGRVRSRRAVRDVVKALVDVFINN